MARFAVILPAAGKSSRFNDPKFKKPFAPLGELPVWLHSARRFLNRGDVQQVVVVIDADDESYFRSQFADAVADARIDVVIGGAERTDSVEKGLAAVAADIDFVAVHDAARPCVADAWIDAVFQQAEKMGAAILALPVTGTIKRVVNTKSDEQSQIEKTVSRENLWEAQTPQVVRKDLLEKAYVNRGSLIATDEAQLLERAGIPCCIVQGSRLNIKITTREDMTFALHALNTLK